MKQWKISQIITNAVYRGGWLWVAFFTAGYIRHSEVVPSPDAMLPMMEYERCVIALLFSLPFLLAACVMLVIMFPERSKVQKIAAFLPVLIAVSVVGYDIYSENANAEPLPPSFNIAVKLDTDCDIYAVSGAILLGGEEVSGQTCTNANQKPFQKGEEITLTVTEQDIPEGYTLDEMTVTMTVCAENNHFSTPIEVKNGEVTCTSLNDTVSLTVTGNPDEGFTATQS